MQRSRSSIETLQNRDNKEINPQSDTLDDEKNHSATPFSFVQSCRCCLPKIKLHTSTEIPAWMARPYITQGYRPSLSPTQCLASLGYFHNESINIWSHLLGFLLMIGLAVRGDEHYFNADLVHATDLFPHSTLVYRIFLLAAAACLLASATYHAGNCNGDKTCCEALLRIDATGVATLIAASFLPGVYFGFACYPDLRRNYLIVTALLLVVGVGVSLADTCAQHLTEVDMSLNESLHTNEQADHSNEDLLLKKKNNKDPAAPKSLIERIRVITFVLSVCLGGAGIVQWTFLVSDEAREHILPKTLGMFFFYGFGFFFYISHFPEAWWPGSFDYIMHSHQFWHVCVVAAVVVWYAACLEANVDIGENGCKAFRVQMVDGISRSTIPRLRATAMPLSN